MKKKITILSLTVIILIIVITSISMLRYKYTSSMSEEEIIRYCEKHSENNEKFCKYGINDFSGYIFLMSISENPELFIFEKDNLYKSRYYYFTDSIGLVDETNSIGMVIVYMKKENEDEAEKELIVFSNNDSNITKCTYNYKGKEKQISLNGNEGFIFNVDLEGEKLLDEIIESIKFYNGEGNEIQ